MSAFRPIEPATVCYPVASVPPIEEPPNRQDRKYYTQYIHDIKGALVGACNRAKLPLSTPINPDCFDTRLFDRIEAKRLLTMESTATASRAQWVFNRCIFDIVKEILQKEEKKAAPKLPPLFSRHHRKLTDILMPTRPVSAEDFLDRVLPKALAILAPEHPCTTKEAIDALVRTGVAEELEADAEEINQEGWKLIATISDAILQDLLRDTAEAVTKAIGERARSRSVAAKDPIAAAATVHAADEKATH